MAIEYQFTDSSKWSLIWSENYTAEPVLNVLERYYPIGNVSPGITLSVPTIAVWCYNDQAPLNWKYGARYFAKIATGITVNAGTPETVLKSGKIYLNQIEVIQFPNYSSTFGIDFNIPYWHRNFQIKIWEYTGNNQNTVHRKLDDLLGYPQPS